MGKRSRRPRPRSGPNDPFLPQQYQGRAYRVRAVIVRAEIEILDGESVETRFLTEPIPWYESAWGKSIRAFLRGLGAKIDGD